MLEPITVHSRAGALCFLTFNWIFHLTSLDSHKQSLRARDHKGSAKPHFSDALSLQLLRTHSRLGNLFSLSWVNQGNCWAGILGNRANSLLATLQKLEDWSVKRTCSSSCTSSSDKRGRNLAGILTALGTSGVHMWMAFPTAAVRPCVWRCPGLEDPRKMFVCNVREIGGVT